MVYNTILDQHDKKINPIIISSEYTRDNEGIRRIINNYDVAKQQIIFRIIIMDEYGRDLEDYSLKIDWNSDEDCPE